MLSKNRESNPRCGGDLQEATPSLHLGEL